MIINYELINFYYVKNDFKILHELLQKIIIM